MDDTGKKCNECWAKARELTHLGHTLYEALVIALALFPCESAQTFVNNYTTAAPMPGRRP